MIVPGSVCLAFHPEHAWVPGVVDHFDGKHGHVTVSYPKKETLTKLKEDEIFICDESEMQEDVNDLLNLSVLHDGTLLGCLRERYFRDIVYTNIGAIVVAINPFNFKIPWYMDDKMKSYLEEGEVIQNNLPHSWAVAHNTYYEMRNDQGNQCILVSGESGAGKTEASKIVMKYLGAISATRAPTPALKQMGITVGERLMKSNPILEAFGNAKTVRNDNSSRFGKLMRIKFNAMGVLTGADITKYLLEKSRIVTASADERVYHSFYVLLKGKDASRLGLSHISKYKSVNAGGCVDIPEVDDGADYQIVSDAMQTCGVDKASMESIWRCLAGILTLQLVEFEEKDGPDQCNVVEDSHAHLKKTAEYWSVDYDTLLKELTSTTLVIQKQVVTKELNRVKAYDARDSLCKTAYDNVFAWLVTTINKTIDTAEFETWIALLDIFGFEDFKVNSFEQLCINLTNETLQGHYNNFIFIRDMEECRAEGIDTTEIEFPDNKPCIDMISAKGGILAILDEECMLGKATDLTFLDKICDKFGKHPFFERPRLAKVPSFRVHHYAGSVTYDVDGFIEKNRDTLKDAFKLMMRESMDAFMANLLPAPAEGSKFTVGGFFKNQLRDLMELINGTNPHWIRCIKPHPAKKPRLFDGVQTLVQLRSSGVLGTVQIRKAGFPIRLKLEDFCRRYRVIAANLSDVDTKNLKQLAARILSEAEFVSRVAQVGKSRVFLKSEAYQRLEILKKQRLKVFADTAVAAALITMARQRTAFFLRIAYIKRIQSTLRARESQSVFRVKEYDTKKDTIIAHVRTLLKLQKDEERARATFDIGCMQTLTGLKMAEREAFAKIEAMWWAAKPARDAKDREALLRAEQELRGKFEQELLEASKALIIEMEESRLDAVAAQEEREAEEQAAELRRVEEEQERLREEELQRLEAERIENERRREEQRRIAVQCWNKFKIQQQEEKRRRETEEANKMRWIKECATSTMQALQLAREEPILQSRERLLYPPERFVPCRNKNTALSLSAIRTSSGSPKPSAAPTPACYSDTASFSNSPVGPGGAVDSHAGTLPSGIGGLNPKFVSPAKEKEKKSQQQLFPDRSGSLDLVQRMRKLQHVKDPIVIRTPILGGDDVRNPLNPNSPDWQPPAGSDVIILPDGSQLDIRDVQLQEERKENRRRRRRTGE